jgi:mycothiol system anti-sigma-R factor
MNCADVRAKLHAYVDGELPVNEITALDAHCMECERCVASVRDERALRSLLRRQPRETAPPELRARIRQRLRREQRVAAARPWVFVSAAAAAAAIVVGVLLPTTREAPPLVADLVDKHIAYAQIERPAELASSDRAEVADWFRTRAGMRVTVPDYSPSGIRLVGARLAEAHERKAAYLLYEKGRTLLSVFMVPVSQAEGELRGRRVAYRGHDYLAFEQKSFRTVSWTDGQTLYGLVSLLPYDALLECADRLRVERLNQTRL